jgi:hypothetical protein
LKYEELATNKVEDKKNVQNTSGGILHRRREVCCYHNRQLQAAEVLSLSGQL